MLFSVFLLKENSSHDKLFSLYMYLNFKGEFIKWRNESCKRATNPLLIRVNEFQLSLLNMLFEYRKHLVVVSVGYFNRFIFFSAAPSIYNNISQQ